MIPALYAAPPPDRPFREERLVFPPQKLHNHGSCIVELPNGDFLACWYRGSGERSADDVAICGARLGKTAKIWSEPFVMADTPGFPDCNPCMIVDPHHRLWLFWPVILDNHWESALLRFKSSLDFSRATGPPKWDRQDDLLLKPGPEFQETVERDLDRQWAPYMAAANEAQKARLTAALALWHQRAATPLSVRLGWMPRAHPVMSGDRMLLPLYSDGFDFSLIAISDDFGETWKCSTPLVGPGNVQPSIARRTDGTLVAYYRDNGPPPQRVMVSESADDGMTWTLARDTDLPDPGAGLEVLVLKSGRWLLINNNTASGRHRLSISISDDQGKTWPRAVAIEDDTDKEGPGSYAYPSILQARDGSIHMTYSYTASRDAAQTVGAGESIKHVRVNEAWLLAHVVPRTLP